MLTTYFPSHFHVSAMAGGPMNYFTASSGKPSAHGVGIFDSEWRTFSRISVVQSSKMSNVRSTTQRGMNEDASPSYGSKRQGPTYVSGINSDRQQGLTLRDLLRMKTMSSVLGQGASLAVFRKTQHTHTHLATPWSFVKGLC